MYYKEFLRARNSVFIYTLVWAGLFLLTAILSVWLPMGEEAHKAAHVGGNLIPQPWPNLLGFAAIAASIVATVLGSTLSQEADGHLEFALTKPASRVAYASVMIAVDFAAIFVAVFVGFAFVWLHYAIFHHTTTGCCQGYRLVAGPDPVFNALRFLLFPLAWYAIIVGLSAGWRGKAGIVQGLIWPLAIAIAALRELPSTGGWQAWHDLFVALNVFNPLMYVSYDDRVSETTVQFAAGHALPAIVSAAMLALFMFAGWASAALQWRRVEA
jgi:hypothetical protein